MAGDPSELFDLLDRVIAGFTRRQGDTERDPAPDRSRRRGQTEGASGSKIFCENQDPEPDEPVEPEFLDEGHSVEETLSLLSSNRIGDEHDDDIPFKTPSNNSGSSGSSGSGPCFLREMLEPDAGPDKSSGPGINYGDLKKRCPVKGEGEGVYPWLDIFSERAAHREFDGGCSRIEAERLAWSEVELRWHLLRGERVPRNVCAGCCEPFDDTEVLDLIDGSRVHLGGERRCLELWTQKWRAAAKSGLQVIGLKCPKSLL